MHGYWLKGFRSVQIQDSSLMVKLSFTAWSYRWKHMDLKLHEFEILISNTVTVIITINLKYDYILLRVTIA